MLKDGLVRQERGTIPCRIVLPNEEVVDAALKLRTEIGACLSVSRSFVVPDCFRLSIGPLAEQCDVQVVWRQPSELGVVFRDRPSA